MKRVLFAIAIMPILASCDNKPVPQPPFVEFTSTQAEDARQAASALIGANGQALFVCGQADGLGLFTAAWEKGFSPDGMKDGRLVFLIRNDGKPDLYFRDASGAFLSAIDDGGEVRRISDPKRQIESWIITYPATGITETHNITSAAESELVDLWTSNKPTSVIGASAKLFRSKCVRA
ncbi:MAG: hypothetical protein ACKOPM_13135 [Novosphingobium sp.]